MIKDDYYKHIEYVNPRLHTKALTDKIGILIVAPAFFLTVMILLFITVQKGNREFLLIAMMLGPVLGIPLIWIMKDSISFFLFPLKSYNAMAKIVMTQRDISIIVGQTVDKRLKWEEIKIIEKTRRDEGIVILLIINPYDEKCVVCSEKNKNYIQIPSRITLIKAIERFSGKKVAIADPEVNRFIRG
jgi:hypothetical protein